MANKSLACTFVTLLIFSMVLAPMLTSEAARLPHRDILQEEIICPACVCCTPAPEGECCDCCAAPIESQSLDGSP
ncbi:hypothetical protein RJ641_019915 [Dillenia turbinata]|uniref:Uncharacterized protein n=1 Tax=Dillenia turbinata TaxID=194707 RepID=A0AAN8UDG6_9MAGN